VSTKNKRKELKIHLLARLGQKVIKEEVLRTRINQHQKNQLAKVNLLVNQERTVNRERIALRERTARQDRKAIRITKLTPELEAKLDPKAKEKKRPRQLSLKARKILQPQEVNRRTRRLKQEDVSLLKATPLMLRKVQAEVLQLKDLPLRNPFPKARK